MLHTSMNTHYSFLLNGGASANGDTFKYEGITYQFLTEKYDTIEELKSYLMEIFTEESADEYLAHTDYILSEGKLAEIYMGGMGTLVLWSKAEAKLVDISNNQRIYELKVPSGELGYINLKVVFVYVEGMGWRISNSPDNFW